MEFDVKEKLESISAEIIEAVQSDDQEALLEAFRNIPDSFWKDRECYLRIIETFLDWVSYDFYVYLVDIIPDYFWKDEASVWAYVVTLGEYYDDERIHFNMGELIPDECLEDIDILKLLLKFNCDELISDLSEDQKADSTIVFAALEGVQREIEYRGMDERECLKYLIDNISVKLASDKKFILEFLEFEYSYRGLDLIYDWIDKELWKDKEFVIAVLENDSDALEYVSEELMSDEEFKNFIEENF